MIRNAVLHLANEQPLLVDLYTLPSPADAGMVCTNLRLMDGRRPVFVDDSKSTFFFPYRDIRFIEVPPRSMPRGDGEAEPEPESALVAVGNVTDAAPPVDDDGDLELDEDFLARIRQI